MARKETPGIDFTSLDWTITSVSNILETSTANLQGELSKALEQLASDPTNTKALADYQSALSSYTIFRNMHSNTIKALKDIDTSLVQNLR